MSKRYTASEFRGNMAKALDEADTHPIQIVRTEQKWGEGRKRKKKTYKVESETDNLLTSTVAQKP